MGPGLLRPGPFGSYLKIYPFKYCCSARVCQPLALSECLDGFFDIKKDGLSVKISRLYGDLVIISGSCPGLTPIKFLFNSIQLFKFNLMIFYHYFSLLTKAWLHGNHYKRRGVSIEERGNA